MQCEKVNGFVIRITLREGTDEPLEGSIGKIKNPSRADVILPLRQVKYYQGGNLDEPVDQMDVEDSPI